MVRTELLHLLKHSQRPVPADRAVVIIGQGHEYLLREFVRLNLNLRDVDPLQYLNT
jgi:hypothetical protein